jgi:IS5 family transposase
VKHKTKPAVHGFKAHAGADAGTALVGEVLVTPANVHDGRAGFAALPQNPGEVFADSAYRGQVFAEAVRARGGTPRIVAIAMWGRDEQETLGRLKAHNRPIHQVRGRIEKIFGTWKRSYSLRRMRWRGIAKATAQVPLTAIAYNLKRSLTITTQPACIIAGSQPSRTPRCHQLICQITDKQRKIAPAHRSPKSSLQPRRAGERDEQGQGFER